jgi:hypothetical protein
MRSTPSHPVLVDETTATDTEKKVCCATHKTSALLAQDEMSTGVPPFIRRLEKTYPFKEMFSVPKPSG